MTREDEREMQNAINEIYGELPSSLPFTPFTEEEMKAMATELYSKMPGILPRTMIKRSIEAMQAAIIERINSAV